VAGKRKITISLDDELVRELERGGNVSAQLNDAGWALVERRLRTDRLPGAARRAGPHRRAAPGRPRRGRPAGPAAGRRGVIVALDSEAFNALAGPPGLSKQRVRRVLRRAQRLGRDVLVPSVVLAELYRGRGHNQVVDACLARESASLDTRDTDRHFARIVGGVLAGAGAGSDMIVDAHVVAIAVEQGGGVVVTGDVEDLERLSGPYPHIVVEAV
jgi:predicted nucleic acid-binding protein